MHTASPQHTAASHPAILIVDDEELTQKSLQRFLRLHQYSAICVGNAGQALEVIRTYPALKLVLSDYKMPGMNGIEFLRSAASLNPNIRRIMLSAFDDSPILLTALNEGSVHRFLVKPWQRTDLLAAVEEQLAEYLRLEKERNHVVELARRQHMLALSNHQLNALIVERTSELQEREQSLKTANERLRLLTGHLDMLREEERRAIALNIHDDLAQALTAIQLTIAPYLRSQSDTAPRVALVAVKEQVDAVISTVQRILSDLRPQVLDELGLNAALDWLIQDFRTRSGLECHLDVSADTTHLAPKAATCLYRIAQEALTNILRHAGASVVNLRLCSDIDHLQLTIEDNGRGINHDPVQKSCSYGIIGMQERAALCGGSCTVQPGPLSGTVVAVAIPKPVEEIRL